MPTGGGTAEQPTADGQHDREEPHSVSEEELFDVLANTRRRNALHAIAQAEGTTHELGTLSERVAAWENEIDVTEVSYDERKRVYTALQQSHLPKLDEVGLVSFDKDRGTVDATPALGEVEIYLDVVRGKEIPWSEYYLGLSGVSMALLAAVWVGAYPFTLVPDLGWFAFVVVAFTVSATVNRYFSTEMKLGDDRSPPNIE
ncbi:DUF7344 domain-containing protein [Halobaculum gomorrense]|uniref:DUF7344 domain-containing protein n=1 Tax=Halobaculum gomorrense TaxID=43928 RepID=A0A1M5UG50_9EURY|nr:hypothetical protein SAMN05443636_3021 [Halobaculum gomorrense]